MPLVPLAPFKTPRRAAAAQVSQLFSIPAPTGGLNYRDPIAAMSVTDALVLTNFIPKQTGVEIRKGWQIRTETIEESIESIFGFKANADVDTRIFAAAAGDIWDVTEEPATVAVSATGSTDDEWHTTMFSTPADTFLLAVSPGAGYWTYDTTNGWVQRTVTNLPANVKTVTVWKNRVWFTVQDDQNVYYLDSVDAITGTATAFPMGSLLRNGGSVAALINWTLDAGIGVDDYLVMVSTQGDIGVWQGTDPTDPDKIGLKGVWYVGPVPTRGTFHTAFGGDVMIVSEFGLVPMSRLINGQFSEQQPGPAAKIQSVLSPLIADLKNEPYWDVFPVPSEDLLVIKLPAQGGTHRQFAMNVTTGAWCQFTGIPMRCASMIGGRLYFGTVDGYTAFGLFGNTDQALIDGSAGEYIQCEMQTSFQSFNTPAQLKKFGMARPIFIGPAAPTLKIKINTQYSFTGVGGAPAYTGSEPGEWDNGVWNTAIWAGNNTYQSWYGVNGLGYYGSLRLKVRGLPETVFTSSHLMTELGGVM